LELSILSQTKNYGAWGCYDKVGLDGARRCGGVEWQNVLEALLVQPFGPHKPVSDLMKIKELDQRWDSASG